MSLTNVGYINTYSEYPTVTKVYRKPAYKTLRELKNRLKTNTSKVTSDLGGGTNGHFEVVCTVA